MRQKHRNLAFILLLVERFLSQSWNELKKIEVVKLGWKQFLSKSRSHIHLYGIMQTQPAWRIKRDGRD